MKKRKRYLCYLRTHRRVWGLTQRELARIFGYRSATPISRIEAGQCIPGMEIALASQILFGVPPDAMFPQHYGEIEEKMMQRIYQFHQELLHLTSLSDLRKRELMELALRRAVANPKLLKGV